MKFYGEIKNSVESNGYYFVQGVDLNTKKEVTICSMSSKNSFNSYELNIGDRIACELKDYKGKFFAVSSEIRKYEKKSGGGKSKKPKDDLAIRLGNAVTIANELGYNPSEIPSVASQAILPVVDELRDVLTREHPEMDAYALGARLGQCSIIIAKHTEGKLTSKAESRKFQSSVRKLFNEMTKVEASLRNK